MSTLELMLALGLGSLVAGFLGVPTGLGGGVVIVSVARREIPMDIQSVIGASLVSAIATSSGAAAPYDRQDRSNIRVGIREFGTRARTPWESASIGGR